MLVVVFFVWVETTFGGNREATTWPCIRYPVRLPNLTAFWRQIIPHSLKERVIGLPPWVKHVRSQEMQLVFYTKKKKKKRKCHICRRLCATLYETTTLCCGLVVTQFSCFALVGLL
uniref:Putative secreted protein n=1 Tax=Ixodes ricinus TaxID=34613 RepID=A0A6B0UL57_IXORI